MQQEGVTDRTGLGGITGGLDRCMTVLGFDSEDVEFLTVVMLAIAWFSAAMYLPFG